MIASFESGLEGCCLIMKFIGFYYEGDLTDEARRRRRNGCILLVFFVCPTVLGYIHGIITSESSHRILMNISHILVGLNGTIKCCNVLLKREKILIIKEEIVEIQKKIAKDERHKNLNHLQNRLDFTLKNYIRYMKLIGLTDLFIIMLSVALGNFPIEIFGGLENGSIEAWVSVVYLDCVSFYACVVYASINILQVILVPYAIGFNDELAARLKYLGVSKEFDFDELKESIEIHQMIKNLVGEVNDCFRLMFYLQNIYSQLAICMFVFNLAFATDFKTFVVAIAFIMISVCEILLPCYFGSELEKSSKNLTDAIYQSDWLNCELKTKKLMVTFMENLKQPMQIDCYLIFNISLELFANIMNEAYSFYCVLAELA